MAVPFRGHFVTRLVYGISSQLPYAHDGNLWRVRNNGRMERCSRSFTRQRFVDTNDRKSFKKITRVFVIRKLNNTHTSTAVIRAFRFFSHARGTYRTNRNTRRINWTQFVHRRSCRTNSNILYLREKVFTDKQNHLVKVRYYLNSSYSKSPKRSVIIIIIYNFFYKFRR